MRTTTLLVAAGVLLVAGALRLRSYLRAGNARTGYLAIAATAAGLALLLNAAGPYEWCDRVIFRHPNTSALTSYALTAIGATAACEMVANLVDKQTTTIRRLRLTGSATVTAAMIIAFVVASPSREDALFFEHYRHDAHLVAFWILFAASVALQMVYVAILTLRAARDDDKWLARGLRLIGSGATCVAIFLLDCLLQVAVRAVPATADTIGVWVLLTGGFLLASGVLLPQVGLFGEHTRLRRQLYPLWNIVTSEYPYVRCDARRPNLYRTVIEVEDALAEARAHRELNTPLLRALDARTARPAEQFTATVDELLAIMRSSETMPTHTTLLAMRR